MLERDVVAAAPTLDLKSAVLDRDTLNYAPDAVMLSLDLYWTAKHLEMVGNVKIIEPFDPDNHRWVFTLMQDLG